MASKTLTNLYQACSNANVDDIALALKAGADPNAAHDEYSQSALLNALMADCARGAALLVEAGATVTTIDEDGLTPLHFAAMFGDAVLVGLMLAKGANPAAVSKSAHPVHPYFKKGSTALDIAKRFGDKELIAAFSQKPAAKPAGKTTAKAKTLSFDDKLATLRALAISAVDFEGCDDRVSDALAGKGRGKSLVSICMTGSGSIFALYRKSPKDALETAPVVYLDSEGDPRGVVAQSLDEFLTLLPFGTGFLYDALAGSRASKAKGAGQKALANTSEEVGVRDGKSFVDWWSATFAANPAGDPIAIIGAAKKACADVEKWLA